MTACERSAPAIPPTPSAVATKPPPIPSQNGVDPQADSREPRPSKARSVRAKALAKFLKDACPRGYKSSPIEHTEAGVANAVASQARRDCIKAKQSLITTLTDLIGAEGMVGPVRQLGKLKPYPGHADGFYEYDPRSKKGRAQLIVNNRYVFGVVGEQVSDKELKAALAMFDVHGLEVYKPSADDLLPEPK